MASRLPATIACAFFSTFPWAAPLAAESDKLFARSEAAPPPPGGLSSLGQVTGALLVVLAVVFIAAWMLRRLKLFSQRGAGHLEVLGEISIGVKERAVLLKVGDKRVLVGVAPGSVTALHVLNADELPENKVPEFPAVDANPSAPNFKALLRQSLGLK